MTIFHLTPNTPNIGNQLIALGAEILLRAELGRDVKVVSIPSVEDGGLKGGGLTSRTVYEMNQLADGVVIGPGNLLENGALDVDLTALQALRPPLMLFGVSKGRIFDRLGKLIARTDGIPESTLRALCNVADGILVRDCATQTQIEELAPNSADVMGCPALFIPEDPHAVPPPDGSLANTVLLSVRNPRLMSVPYSAQGKVRLEVQRIVQFFRVKQVDVRLLCHDYQDLAFAQTFSDVPSLYTEDATRFLSWLRGCRLNVGFRLHAFVCCVALGTPSIPITYDERSMSLINTLGFADWGVPLLHSADILAEIEKRYQSLSSFPQLLAESRLASSALRNTIGSGLQDFGRRIRSYTDSQVF
jgi:hypothetical protein